jgi:hypothetical protein
MLTFSTAVGVDCPYQDELGRRMRDVAEDVENIELHGGLLRGTDGDTARGLSHVTGSPSLTRKIRSGRGECSDAGSGFLMAFNESGKMHVRCGECGQLLVVVVVVVVVMP